MIRRTLNGRLTAVVLLCAGLAHAAEEPVGPSPAPPGPQAEAPQDDLDSLLNLDPESLSRVDVVQTSTLTDPVVDSVSKTPEKVSEAPGIVDVITAQDIREFGAKNLYEVLERATSVYMTGSFMHRRNMASIRGNLIKHEDNHVLVLINGRPFRDVNYGGLNQSVYTAFPLEAIARIEVIRGPGSVLYGTNAATGVINVVTKAPDRPTAHASSLNGAHGWQSYTLAAGNAGQDSKLYVAANYLGQTGWPLAATLEDSVTDVRRMSEDNVGVYAGYQDGGFTANAFVADIDQATIGPSNTWPAHAAQNTRVFVDLGYTLDLSNSQSLQTNFTYNHDNYSTVANVPPPANTLSVSGPSQSYLLESAYRAQPFDDLSLLIGGVADIHEGVEQSTGDFTEIWYGAYLQLDYRPTDWLKLVGGMQANMPGDIKSGIVPRAAAIVDLSESLTAKLLYGQAFRSPYYVERHVNAPGVLVGNAGLTPEVSQTFDAQLAYRTEDFRFAATWFHTDFFGVVSRVGTFPQTYVNGSRIEYSGVELENDWRLNDRLRWMCSATYQTNVRDGVNNTTGVPNWMAKMGLAYTDECRGLSVGVFDTFYGKPTVPATAAIVNPDPAAYHLVSVNTTLDLARRLGWRDGRSLRAQFLVQNLFGEDIHHIEFERELINSLPAGAGATCYGGLTYEY